MPVAEGWKEKYGGLQVSEAKRLRQLEEKNQQLKHLVAELTLDNRALKAAVKKVVGPREKREAVLAHRSKLMRCSSGSSTAMARH